VNLHEYQAKKLFADYGLPVSEGYAVDTADQAVAAAEKIGELVGSLKSRSTRVDGVKQEESSWLIL